MDMELKELGKAAAAVKYELACMPEEEKNHALLAVAEGLIRDEKNDPCSECKGRSRRRSKRGCIPAWWTGCGSPGIGSVPWRKASDR